MGSVLDFLAEILINVVFHAIIEMVEAVWRGVCALYNWLWDLRHQA